MALGPLSVTAIRNTAIDYSNAFIVDYLNFVQNRPERSINPYFFINAVNYNVSKMALTIVEVNMR